MVLGLAVSGTAKATLIERGGGLIYDTDLDITWLQDANFAQTSGFDADGLMSWVEADSWANNLFFGNFGDWHLPRISNLQHLYFDELGNIFGQLIPNTGPFINVQLNRYWSIDLLSSDPNFAKHLDFRDGRIDQSGRFGIPFAAWAVGDGDVAAIPTPSDPIPEPSTIILLSLGLAGLGFFRRLGDF